MTNNLKCMLAAKLLPSVLEQFTTLINAAFIGDGSDGEDSPTPFADNSEPIVETNEKKVTLLPSSLYKGLLQLVQEDDTIHHGTQYYSIHESPSKRDVVVLSAVAEYVASVKHRGKRFSTATHCESDSHVIYRAPPQRNRLVLGQIDRLFVHKRKCLDGQFHHQVFAAVRQYLELEPDDAKHDPYRQYPGLRTSLIYDALSSQVQVIPMKDIVAHFATCRYHTGDITVYKIPGADIPIVHRVMETHDIQKTRGVIMLTH